VNLGERHLAREAYRRLVPQPRLVAVDAGDRATRFLAQLFDKQREFIESPSRRKVAFCTRRAGKTKLFASYLLAVALKTGALCTYYAITRIRAKQLIWDELKALSNAYALDCTFNETELEARTPNGGIIRLTGADKMSEAEKKLGDKNAIAIIDESQLYPPNILDRLINRVLKPTLLDLRGSLVLGGTPGIVCSGFWYDITRNEGDESEAQRIRGWDVYEWSLFQNPFLPHAREEVDAEKRENGWADDDPRVLREYGDTEGRPRWVNDARALFYRYSEARNAFDELPSGHDWQHVVGVDLGYDDAFAIVVWAFARTCPQLYERYEFEKSGLVPSEWREKLAEVIDTYRPIRVVADTGGLGKAIVEEWRKRWRMHVEAAEKQNKKAFVSLFNDDLTGGRIKVPRNSLLADEWKKLPKDPDNPEEEHPGFPNHRSDAALYSWREALHWLGRSPDEQPQPGSREYAEAEARRHEDALEQRLSRQARWGDDFPNFGDADE
jgi:hypothetical protein